MLSARRSRRLDPAGFGYCVTLLAGLAIGVCLALAFVLLWQQDSARPNEASLQVSNNGAEYDQYTLDCCSITFVTPLCAFGAPLLWFVRLNIPHSAPVCYHDAAQIGISVHHWIMSRHIEPDGKPTRCLCCCKTVTVTSTPSKLEEPRAPQQQLQQQPELPSPKTSASTLPPAAPKVAKATFSPAQSHGDVIAAQPASREAAPRPKCGTLSKELLRKYAVSNTVMITVNDMVTVQQLSRHWLRNVHAANITYWLILASDEATAQYLEEQGISRCALLPSAAGRAKADGEYRWQGKPWIAATWRTTEAAAQVGG